MMLFLTFFAFGSIFACSSADTFIVYGEDSNITVLSSTGKEIKKFVIFSNPIKGIAIHYDEDLIFAVDGEKIIKVHLLDDEGNRKVSGKGELFLDQKASHFESVLVVLRNEGIQPRPFTDESVSLTVDTNTHKLYIGGRMYVYEMNYSGKNVRKVIGTNFPSSSSSFYFNNFLFHQNKAFVEVYSSSEREFNGIYETAINIIGMKNLTNASLILGNDDIYSVASGNTSKSIFIVDQNQYQISAMQPEENEDLAPLKEQRILLSNYGVTRGPKALAVNGQTVAWCSPTGSILFVGKMNKNKNFLPLKDIVVIPSVKTYQIALFETSSGQSLVVSSKYWLVIMIAFVNAARNLV